MSIVVKKVTDKNTKKQILEEYDNAVKLIKELESNLKNIKPLAPIAKEKKVVPKESKPQSTEGISIDVLVEKFNDFSNSLKDDMSVEVKVIEDLKEQIEKKIDSIKTIYSSDSSISLDALILSYTNLLKEQEECILTEKKESLDKSKMLQESFDTEKSEHVEDFWKRQEEFKRSSTRTEKSDAYNKTKAIYTLEKEREELVENNKSIVDDVKYQHKTLNKEAYIEINEAQRIQKETLEKAESQKENFEQTVNSKVTSVVTKEKSSNAQAYKSMLQEFENKVTLKSTQLENFENENKSLESQIEKLLQELNTIQEKAHTLASKTIDAKSSTQSFEAMKDVAMEQARGKK